MSGSDISVTKVVSFGSLYPYLDFIRYPNRFFRTGRRGRVFRGMRSRLKSIIYAPRFAWKRRAKERQEEVHFLYSFGRRMMEQQREHRGAFENPYA